MQSFLCFAPVAHFAAGREPAFVRAWIDSNSGMPGAPAPGRRFELGEACKKIVFDTSEASKSMKTKGRA